MFGIPPPLDLSHAAKLKGVEFRLETPAVKWVVATLQTANTECLQQITIFSAATFDFIMEVDHREWQDLDHLLVRLWISHSIIPKVKCTMIEETMILTEAAPNLLSRLVNEGVECEAVDFSEFEEY